VLEELCTAFVKEGGIILNITQCSSGKVKFGLYQTSAMFHRAGVLSGGDLTTEGAITKMMVCLASESPKEELMKNLRGEVTY
jgi:L-asparaginase